MAADEVLLAGEKVIHTPTIQFKNTKPLRLARPCRPNEDFERSEGWEIINIV
jgi:hypothetical protein